MFVRKTADVVHQRAQVATGTLVFRDNGTHNVMADDFLFGKPEKFLRVFIEESDDAAAVPAQDDGVGVLHQFPVTLFAFTKGFVHLSRVAASIGKSRYRLLAGNVRLCIIFHLSFLETVLECCWETRGKTMELIDSTTLGGDCLGGWPAWY